MRKPHELPADPTATGIDGGCWVIHHNPTNCRLTIVASWGEGWDHLSVSTPRRAPNWQEMEFAKRLFFKDDELAVQLHMPVEDHISIHPYTLHIWRPQLIALPVPPKWMV